VERDGTVLKEEAKELQMPRNSLLRVEGLSRGTKIFCRCGLCWITQEGDLKDYLCGILPSIGPVSSWCKP